MTTFSINDALKVGWQKAWQNIWLWVGVLVTSAAINMLFGRLADEVGEGFVVLLVTLASFVVQVIIEIGILTIALRLLDNQPAKYADLFKQYPLAGQFLIAVILGGLAIGAGFILFIIPGIYIAVRLSQAGFLIVDQKLSGIDALKKSWEITKGHSLQLFLLVIVFALINIVGAMALFIGLLVTVPTTTMAMAYVYRKLSSSGSALEIPPVSAVTVPPANNPL